MPNHHLKRNNNIVRSDANTANSTSHSQLTYDSLAKQWKNFLMPTCEPEVHYALVAGTAPAAAAVTAAASVAGV